MKLRKIGIGVLGWTIFIYAVRLVRNWNSRRKMFRLIDKELRGAGRMFNLFASPTRRGLRFIHWALSQSEGKGIDGAESETVWVKRTAAEGEIRVRIFRPKNPTTPLPIILYLHGGGYAIGIPEQENLLRVYKALMKTRPCVIVAPAYRRSFDAPYPAALDDCYDTLRWAKEHAAEIGGRADQIFVMGDSAGGGLTVATCLLARERGDVNVAFQMPLYPMIDDRQTNPSAVANEMPVWNSEFNALAWKLYLGGLADEQVPATAAPVRADSYANLPPTATFIGDLDPFYDETLELVERLKADGVPVRFQTFKGCYHGFEQVVPTAKVSRAAHKFMLDAYAHAVDTHFAEQNGD